MKLTKRGKVVVGVLALIGLWGLWEIATHLWWGAHGWCWTTDPFGCQ